jgi:hypothetical protein
MTTTVSAYLDTVEQAFLLAPIVRSVQVREREARLYEGFIRLRAVLSNGDLLEAFEFVVATSDTLQTLTYRIHWQQADGRLKRRWDNALHHKEVPTFPHHVHVGLADHVESSEPMTILKALALVEGEIHTEEPL